MMKFFKKSKPQKFVTAKTANGDAVYAIGDVHGCFVSLTQLLEKIEVHANIHASHGYRLIFLGDLIDRGPDSKAVVEYLIGYKPPNVELTFLMGNHEEVLLSVLDGNADSLRSWLKFGGRECLRSYAVDNLGQINVQPEALLHRVQMAVPNSHADFVRSFQNYYVCGDYLFVHAGIMPGSSLERQKVRHMRWIREPFLSHKQPFPFKVVHGHTITETATDHGNRISVDTGAHNGGALSALFVKDDIVDFLSVDGHVQTQSDK